MRKLFVIFGFVFALFSIDSPANAQYALCRTPSGQMVRCPPQRPMYRPVMHRPTLLQRIMRPMYQQQRPYYRPVVASAITGAYIAGRYSSYRRSYSSSYRSSQGSGNDLFIAGTPAGQRVVSINEPEKSALCVPPRQLYRTDDCVSDGGGRMTCKLGCQ